MMIDPNKINRIIKKATKSSCHYRISALGINKKGELIGVSTNTPRFSKLGGGSHAEINLMKKVGPSLKTIIICRTNPKGKVMPIHPCEVCQTKADELGIKIIPLHKLLGIPDNFKGRIDDQN